MLKLVLTVTIYQCDVVIVLAQKEFVCFVVSDTSEILKLEYFPQLFFIINSSCPE